MKRNNEGFSLVEIVAAIAILGVFFSAACASLMLGLRMNEKTDAMLQSQLAVSSAVETLMAEGITTQTGKFTSSEKKDEANNSILDENGKKLFVESGLIDDYPKLNSEGQPVYDGNGDPVLIDRFPDVTVITMREKTEDSDYPHCFQVTVASIDGEIVVITYVREAVTVQ